LRRARNAAVIVLIQFRTEDLVAIHFGNDFFIRASARAAEEYQRHSEYWQEREETAPIFMHLDQTVASMGNF
jgi:hypothetical protein